MENEENTRDKSRKVVALLPKENCGKCGYNNCGEFALAIVEGKASPYDCRKSQSAAKEIAQIAGIELTEKVAAHASDGHRHHFPGGDGHHSVHHHEHHHGAHGHGKHHHLHCHH